MTTDAGERTTILDLIDQAAAAYPQSVAVRDAHCILTYSELSIRSERLARHLIALGVGHGDLVGLCLARSISLVVGALGIFRAGGAYVAIDPAYPDGRLRWMLEDSDPAALVSDAAIAERLSSHLDLRTVALEEGGELDADPPADGADLLPVSPGQRDLAYVVYTSGSTGHPKGSMIEHASLSNLVRWHRSAFDLNTADRCGQISSPGFDAAVWEIWPSLASGAAIHIVPEALRTDPIGLRDWLVSEDITVTFLPTAVAEGMIGLQWPKDGSLRYLLTGGDALTRRPSPQLPFTVVNNYGLSETAVVATSGVVSAEGEKPPSIGRPISGVVAEILDERLEPVQQGSSGELVISGVAVGRGYLNQPELTDERFLEDQRGRFYRTGDRARLRENGEIEFLGRLDDQLSIRGFRVEPGEINALLCSHPAIQTGVTLATGSEDQIVAYLVAAGSERPDPDQLSALLAGFLPDYMMPSRYVWLDRLPLTAHGKIDRDALPEIAQGALAQPVGAASETGVQGAIAAIVAELLEVPEVGVDQNFFLLGGHSMLGAQLIVRLEDTFGAEIGLRYLFDHPTPTQLAVEVSRQMATDGEHELHSVSTGGVSG